MTKDQMSAYIAAAAAALDLTIAPEHMPGVLEDFERLAGIAAQVDAFPLAPEHEPAPVWRP